MQELKQFREEKYLGFDCVDTLISRFRGKPYTEKKSVYFENAFRFRFLNFAAKTCFLVFVIFWGQYYSEFPFVSILKKINIIVECS